MHARWFSCLVALVGFALAKPVLAESRIELRLPLPVISSEEPIASLAESPFLDSMPIQLGVVPEPSSRGHRVTALLEDIRELFFADLARGPYFSRDDALGRSVALDVRGVIGFSPTPRVRLEIGYGLAVRGDPGVGATAVVRDLLSGDSTAYVRHGPWIGLRWEF